MGRFNLFKCFYFGVFSDYLWELSLSPIGLSIMTKLSPKKIIWDDDGNVVLASAYGQYCWAAWSRMSSPDEEPL
jgi:dipeptide/tripeptide permease